jgi:hypothetical protein
MADVAVVLHGPGHLAAALADHTGRRVVTAADAGVVADAAAVVGVAAEPWPAFVEAHEAARAAVAATPYFAVQSWHGHPAWIAALTDTVERARAALGEEVHVLFTAPGPGAEPAPHEVVFLREVAEEVSARLDLPRRSIAWVGGGTGPHTRSALAALADAHGYHDVLRVSLDPLGRPDGVHAEASAVGIELHEVRVDPGDLLAVVDAVVATVVGHEGLEEPR